MSYKGDFVAGSMVDFKFTTRRFTSGVPYTLAGTPALRIYKSNDVAQSTTGITLTADFDSVNGLNHVRVDTSADGTFYAAGNHFDVVIEAGTIDSVSVVGEVVGSFSLENRSALMPTTAGRKLDVSAGGEAGIDWANVGSPTTTVGLSGTTVKTATDVETDTADIQGRIPAALVSGRIDASVGAMAANVITAASTAADVVTELQDGIATAANLAVVAGYLDTEIAAIKAKTDNLPTDPADASDIAALLTTIDDFIDTEVAAIKAKTDNLPTDPADASDIAASFATVNTKLDTIDTIVDLIIARVCRNIAFRNITYSGSNLTSVEICLYDTKANADTNDGTTGLLAKYTQTATYSGSNLATFKQTLNP